MRPHVTAERPPSVCIVRHNYYPDLHVRRDAESLADAGYDVSVVALRRPGQPPREKLNGVDVHRMPVEHKRAGAMRYVWEYLAFFVHAFWTVTRLHLRKRFRIVEVDNMPDVLVYCALIPKLTGAKVIFYVFDNMPDLLQVTHGLSTRHPAIRVLLALERLSAAFAERVVVTQEPARQLMERRGVPRDRLTVVLNCPDEAIFTPGEPRRASRRNGVFQIVTHGAILERYGTQILIDALAKIPSEIVDARLDVFGEGEYRAVLEQLAIKRGVADRVRFHGLVALDELVDSLRSADVGYVGMLCDLMLSNKLLEYVVLGVPAVVSRWPTYEYYFPDDSVTYFRPGDASSLADAIVRVYRDPEGAYERAARASIRYADYRWPVQRDVYHRMYADLLGAPQTSARNSRSGESLRSWQSTSRSAPKAD